MACKGICNRFKAKKPLTGRRYDTQKRCQICGIFIETVAIWCECCGTKLRTTPRNNKNKKKYVDEKRIPEPVLTSQIILTI